MRGVWEMTKKKVCARVCAAMMMSARYMQTEAREKERGARSTDVSLSEPNMKHRKRPLWSLPTCQSALHRDRLLRLLMCCTDRPETHMQTQTHRHDSVGVGVQSRPRGGMTVMTNSVSKARVYFFHIWIPISLGDCEAHWRPPQSRLCPMGNLACRSLWLCICWMWEETSRCDQREKTYVEVVSQKQTSFIRVHLFDSYSGNPAESLQTNTTTGYHPVCIHIYKIKASISSESNDKCEHWFYFYFGC